MSAAVAPEALRTATADVEVVIPVFNEQAGLDASVRRLHSYLTERFPLRWGITIADNASTDGTWGVACALAGALPGVRAVHLEAKGRGGALKAAWTASTAAVVAYMDVDLSTDLDALLPLVAPLVSGHSDVAVGSRLAPGARVVRGSKREVISRCYNLLLRTVLLRGSDAQCGFKAVRADVARVLLPLVADDGWFFDTELLALAERNRLRIHEVPVDWVDDPDSRVDVVATALGDLRGVCRVLRQFARGGGLLPAPVLEALGGSARPTPALSGQLLRFAGIGVASTVAFALLFIAMVGPVGAVAADVAAFCLTAAANLAANRRVTFGLRRLSTRRALVTSLVPLALNLTVAITLAGSGTAEVLGWLTLVNAMATAGRFVLLRSWVFGRR